MLLAAGQPHAALKALRSAWVAWRDMEAPYEAARTRELIGRACRELGDTDTADMELDAAAWIFRQLTAAQDLARVDFAAGYRFTSYTQLKIQYSFQQETSGEGEDNHLFAAQFTVRF